MEKLTPLFLDKDGVVVNPGTCIAYGDSGILSMWDPVSCRLILKLCRKFDLTIVVSAQSRNEFDDETFYMLMQNGAPGLGKHLLSYRFPSVYKEWWRTGNTGNRAEEIQTWLDKAPFEYDNFIILDDSTLTSNPEDTSKYLTDHLIRTDCYDGFLFRHYMDAEALLEGRPRGQ